VIDIVGHSDGLKNKKQKKYKNRRRTAGKEKRQQFLIEYQVFKLS